MSFLDRALRMGEAKKFKTYEQRVSRIGGFEEEFEHHSDEELREAADALRERARDGESLDDLLFECFALVREAAKRSMGMRHFDVQLIGGMVLHDGAIAEMKTGEGKTLTATLPVVLNSLGGRGRPRGHGQRLPGAPRRPVDEARLRRARGVGGRSCRTCSPTRRSGPPTLPTSPTAPTPSSALTTCATTWPSRWRRRFRTEGAPSPTRASPRTTPIAIVDEVDNILIDEARTPLIISGAPEQAADLYAQFARLAPQLKLGKTPDGMDPRSKKEFVADFDYEFDEKHKTVSVTEQGVAKAERFLNIDHLYRAENGHLVNHLHQSLKAQALYTATRTTR